MSVLRGPRCAYGAFAWLVLFTVSHVVLVFFPGDDPTGGGPWDMRAYVIFNVVLISMSAVGAALVVATVRPWARHFPRWLLLTPLCCGSVLLVVRGVPGMAENLLMVTGIRRGGFVGAEDISTGEFWAGIGINTYFFAGAVLLVAATVSYAHRSTAWTGGFDDVYAFGCVRADSRQVPAECDHRLHGDDQRDRWRVGHRRRCVQGFPVGVKAVRPRRSMG